MVKNSMLQKLANDYEISLELVKMYNEKFSLCPLFYGDEESLLECLEEFILERFTYELQNEVQPLDYTYSNILYRKYGDRSIPYLSDSYKNLYQISYDNRYWKDLLKEESTFNEEIYDYQGISRR